MRVPDFPKGGPGKQLLGSVVLTLALLAVIQTAVAEDHEHRVPADPYVRSAAAYDVPNVVLVDRLGREAPLRSILEHDGPVVLQFIFTTCPTICPVLSATFQAAQDELGDDVRLVSITIDPEQDTPERLDEYARRFRAGARWIFLTGAFDDVVAVEKAFDVYRGNKMSHEPLTFLHPAPGTRWLRLEGFLSSADLVGEVRAARAP